MAQPKIDLKDPATFDQWVEYFKVALGGTSSGDWHNGDLVDHADEIAQRAVELVQQRARERV